MSTPPTLPKLKYTVKGKTGVKAYWMDPKPVSDPNLNHESGIAFEESSDGKLLGVLDAEGITIRDTEQSLTISRIERAGVTVFGFSPLGSYIVTGEHFQKPPNQRPNLLVWSVSGQILASFLQKILKDIWPPIRWTDDEVICGRLVSNEVHFYAGGTLSGPPIRILKLAGITMFSFAPGPAPYKIAAFVPEKKNAPASVRVYEYPSVTEFLLSQSFHKAQTVDMKWNSSGTALLILGHTDMDTSKSYYGEDHLFFMKFSDQRVVENIVLSKEGPIHDTSWNPHDNEFLIIYGYMPAKATLFGLDCKPKADFGSNHRNIAKWSPGGRLVCIAGFGSLRGDMDIWDPKRLKKIATIKGNTTPNFAEWSPNGDYLLSACLFPRLRVDNAYQIWTYEGNLVYEEQIPELSKISWRPALPGVYPITRLILSKHDPNTSPNTTTTTTSSQPGKYRHPNFSGNAVVLVRDDEEGPQKYNTTTNKKKEQNVPPGFVQETKSQLRNKKKRQNKKAQVTETSPSPSSETQTETSSSEPQDSEKRKKILAKKLRQIEGLKAQLSEGKTLDSSQLEKIAAESSLHSELESLEANTPKK